MSFFNCPLCGIQLKAEPDGQVCPTCNRRWPVEDGIPVFSDSSDFYWSELSREESVRLVEEAKRLGWQQALASRADTFGRARVIETATDETQTGWINLLDLPKKARVLDIGCGWGLDAVVLARRGYSVFAMDLTFERVQFLMVRCRQEGLSSIVPFCAGDALPLPLPGESMHAVVFNGVLEWTPTSTKGNPQSIQLNWLREAHRLLVTGGQLYVGIENRFALPYFFGSLEPHVGLPYVSLLPRWASNYYARRKGRDGYRTYTYTKLGYKRLLAEAGFQEVHFFWPYPHYRQIDEIVSLEDYRRLRQLVAPSLSKDGPKRKTFRDRVKRWLVDRALYGYLVTSYGIVAFK